MPFIHMRHKPLTIAGTMVSVILLLTTTSGCGPIHRRITPETLPSELQAEPIQSAQTIDVSRFAGPTVQKDCIDHGDVLKVALAASLDSENITELSVRIGDDGKGILPEIGAISLAGITLAQAEHRIGNACIHRNLYRNPLVTVAMEQQHVNRVTVAGAVEEPGVVRLPRNSSYLMDAVVAAGGFAEDAGVKVHIRRPLSTGRMAQAGANDSEDSAVQQASYVDETPTRDAEFVCLDLSEKEQSHRNGKYLEDGSVVTIERLKPAPIEVVGLVHKPGQYDFPVDHDLRVSGALALAGGLSNKLADKVLVLRNNPKSGSLAPIRVSLKTMKKNAKENLRLAPGDVVSVEPSIGSVMVDTIQLLRFGIGTTTSLF